MPLLPAPRAVANLFRKGSAAPPMAKFVPSQSDEVPLETDAERTLVALRRLNAVGAAEDPSGALLAALREVPGHPAAAVLLTRPQGDALTLAAASPGLLDTGSAALEPEPFGGLSAAAIASEQRMALIIGDGALPPATLPAWAKERGYFGGIAAPMFNGPLVVGAIYLLKKDAAPATQQVLDLVETLLSFAARLFPADARPDDGPAPGGVERPSPATTILAQDVPPVLLARPAARPADPDEITQRSGQHPSTAKQAQLQPASARTDNSVLPLSPGPPSLATGTGIPATLSLKVPVSPPEPVLVAHAGASQNGRATVSLAGLFLDRGRERVEVGGVHIALSSTEFALLYEIAQARGAPVKSDTLMRSCWQPGEKVTTNALDVAVHRLRKRLCQAPGGKGIVINVPGEGYALRVSPSAESVHGRGLLSAAG